MAGTREQYIIVLVGLITALPDKGELSLNAASSFYATIANINMNVNTNNTHTDPAAPLLKRVGTLQSFSHVIGGSFSFCPVGDDDDDKKKEGEWKGEFREGEETIG